MANPPINRRPGVDASIIQANWVRGYDAPQDGEDPCDLVVSNGQNNTNLSVADILVWNRTDDRTQPMFIMTPGSDYLTADRFNVHAGDLGDPNGIITSPLGSFYISNAPPALWQNQDGADTWKVISDDLGGENLEETLAIGNFTGNNPIVMSAQASAQIRGEDSAVGNAADVKLLGGTASGGIGNGGGVVLTGGLSTNGTTGGLTMTTPTSGGIGSSGSILCQTGTNLVGGNAGTISLRTGGGVQGGDILLDAGDGANPGGDRGGRVQFFGGNSPADGDGGRINFASGSPGTPITFSNGFNAGRAGTINVFAGNSAGTQPGGLIWLNAGKGGSGGGLGGTIVLKAGTGGGGANDGIIDAQGIFEAENYPRGNGDPNVLLVSAEEGSIFQRSTNGLGQAYVNVDGTTTGWAQLLTAGGGIVSALTQIQWGALQASSDDTNEELAADGTFYGIAGGDIVYQLAGIKSMAVGPDGTPTLNFAVFGGSIGGVYANTVLNRDSKSRVTFKISTGAVVDGTTRIFAGFSTPGGNDVNTQLASDNPGGSYFGIWKKTGDTAFRFQADFIGGDNLLSSVTVTANTTYYFAFDLLPDADGGVTVKILSEDYTQLTEHTYSPQNSIIPDASVLRPMTGLAATGAGRNFGVHAISVVTRIDLAEAAFAGGLSGLASPLSQVLMVGNETGGTDMIFNQGDIIQGTTDGDGIDGSTLNIRSGNTTNLGGFTGVVSVFSGDNLIAGATGGTGGAFFSSGSIGDFTNTASGSTGQVAITSGLNLGASGTTGDLTLATGFFGFGGGGALATTGDILMAPGSFAANPANPGSFEMRGGSTTLNGVAGGSVDITSGENTINGNSGSLAFVTADCAVDGATGSILIAAGIAGTNSGNGGTVFISAGSVQAAGALGGSLVLGGGQPVPASGADGGAVFVTSGNSEVGQGKNIEFLTGGSTIGGQRGGDVIVNLGTGPGGDGRFVINGKLTVTGAIDPNSMVFTGQAVIPPESLPGPNEGTIWVDNTGANTVLKYTDDAGATITLGAGGGGGDLTATLALGNNTGPANPIELNASIANAIVGEDSAITDGGNVSILTGTSLGGAGGKGGDFRVTTGTPDAGGNGIGGEVLFTTSAGAGTGEGGDFAFNTGIGGATNARGGNFRSILGAGSGTGNGGGFGLTAGPGGPGVGGDGGTIVLAAGAAGGGVAGTIELVGDTNITGNLQVTGTIDPTGVGFVGQGANPIPIAGLIDGSIWVDVAGDLFFTNLGAGDTNISAAIFGGAGPLAGVLAVGNATGAFGIEFSLASPGITGATNGGGAGKTLSFTAGTSTGGGGAGGGFSFVGGVPDTGAAGGSWSAALAPGDGAGDGGGYTFISGPGGAISGGGGDFGMVLGPGGGTGDGGRFALVTGAGGAGSGSGGDFSAILGPGGPTGAGGKFAVVTGDGGASGDGGDMEVTLGNSTAVTGQGGRFRFFAGNSFGAIKGGNFEFSAGDGGGGGGPGDGGDLIFTGGTPLGAGGFGGVTLLGGGATPLVGTAGAMQVIASPNVGGGDGGAMLLAPGAATVGGNAVFAAGSAQAGSGGDGGDTLIASGAGEGGGDAGDVSVVGGASGTGGGSTPGRATLEGGTTLLVGGTGGSAVVKAGTGAITDQGGATTIQGGDIGALGAAFAGFKAGSGGGVTVRGGVGDAGGDGGTAALLGGLSGPAPGSLAGDARVIGGTAGVGSGGKGGDVLVSGGTPDGAGAPGIITFGRTVAADTINFDSPAIKIGTFVFPGIAGPGPVAIPYAGITQGLGGAPWTVPTSPPRSIQITLEKAGPPVFATIVLGSIAAGFPVDVCVIDLSGAVAGLDVLHIVAYL